MNEPEEARTTAGGTANPTTQSAMDRSVEPDDDSGTEDDSGKDSGITPNNKASTTAQGTRRYDRLDPTMAGSIARRITRRDVNTGDMAQLRRLDPERPACSLFWKIMLDYGVTDPSDPDRDDQRLERAWANVVSTIAEGTKVGEKETQGPHDEKIPMGSALATAGYSERRLNALLNAREDQITRLTNQAAKFLHKKGQNYNCNDLARLMLTNLRSEAQRNADRTHAARQFHRTIYRASQPKRSKDQ